MGVDEKSLYLLFNFVVNLKLPLKIKSIKNNNKKNRGFPDDSVVKIHLSMQFNP